MCTQKDKRKHKKIAFLAVFGRFWPFLAVFGRFWAVLGCEDWNFPCTCTCTFVFEMNAMSYLFILELSRYSLFLLFSYPCTIEQQLLLQFTITNGITNGISHHCISPWQFTITNGITNSISHHCISPWPWHMKCHDEITW